MSPVENKHLEQLEKELYEHCLSLDRAVLLAFKGFVKHKTPDLDQAQQIIDGTKVELNKVLRSIQETPFKDALNTELVISAPTHLSRMIVNLDIILRATQNKIRDSILFSEKAVNELRGLYASVRGLIRDLADLIITNNDKLASFISSQATEIINTAEVYSTEHEERLVRGLCNIRSCTVYLDLLESLKNIAWHIKQSATRVKSKSLIDEL